MITFLFKHLFLYCFFTYYFFLAITLYVIILYRDSCELYRYNVYILLISAVYFNAKLLNTN